MGIAEFTVWRQLAEMKSPILLIGFLFLMQLPVAQASPPPHGSYPWSGLQGEFRFGDCTNNGSPLWAGAPDQTHLLLSTNPFNILNPPADTLVLARVQDQGSSLAINWDFSAINRGPQPTIEENTGRKVGESESFTTPDGLYNRLDWNFGGDDSGWATITVHADSQGQLSYDMKRYSSESAELRTEKCNLIRSQPN